MRSEGYRLTVLVSRLSGLCVCVFSILAVRAIKSSITKDAIVLSVRFAAILKRRFS